MKTTTEPGLIEAATGSGKSHVVAAIAHTLNKISKGKHILCLAPSSELTVQNYEKFLAIGEKASICSASAGRISVKHPVVFGTPGTVINRIERFDDRFCAVICDEAHGITPTIQKIIAAMRERNPNLRVLGLTATPYRMNTGYIYDIDIKGVKVTEAINPYFRKLLYCVQARYLIEQGFLTQPFMGAIHADHYETDHMKLNKLGKYEQEDIDKAFVGHGRKTSLIIADIIAQSKDRKGVIIFAATIQHAQECMESLPPDLSVLIIGDMPKKERDHKISEYKKQNKKYIVNVGVLTTGFDAPHIDVVALLRLSESPGLIAQMLGRGMRLDEGKEDFLILDYAGNIDRHFPDGDIFKPKIETKESKGSGKIPVICPMCYTENLFAETPNEEGYQIDENGYCLDLDGKRIPTKYGFLPGHYGRRCQSFATMLNHKPVQCEYRWTFKPCPNEECGAENDIAARYCVECKTEIIDPNEKLIDEYKPAVYDPYLKTKSAFIDWKFETFKSKSGNMITKSIMITADRVMNVYWVIEGWDHKKFIKETNNGKNKPTAISYKKNNEGFWKVMKYHYE
jgi:DNA repair protein RadD